MLVYGRCYCHFLWLMLYHYWCWQMLLPCWLTLLPFLVADAITTFGCWQMLLPFVYWWYHIWLMLLPFCGWCYCHLLLAIMLPCWLMLLPLFVNWWHQLYCCGWYCATLWEYCISLADPVARLADVIAIVLLCGRCFCHYDWCCCHLYLLC